MLTDLRLTYEDLCALPDNGKRYEIINGELFVTPSPRTAHQKAVGNLYYYLSDFVKKSRVGEVFIAPFDVILSDFDVVEPDLLYIAQTRSHVVTEKNVQGAPDLVIEVISPTTEGRDRSTKLKLYAQFGVKEYWIINPENLSAEVYCFEKGLGPVSVLHQEDVLTTQLLPGFSMLLHKLLE
ncbi:MAG: Uma2 family endonuclease [Terriglobia bacterium]